MKNKLLNTKKQVWRLKGICVTTFLLTSLLLLLIPFSALSQTTMSLGISRPQRGAEFLLNTTTRFEAQTSGGPGVKYVVFRVNGIKVCRDNTFPYECSYTTPNVVGIYKLRVIAVDIQNQKIIKRRSFSVVTSEPPSGELKNPSVGLGLAGIEDWAAQIPFINVMKLGRTWTGHRAGQWGAYNDSSLRAGGHLDNNGWLRSFPADATFIESYALTDLSSADSAVMGRYRLRFTGEGRIEVVGRVSNVTKSPNEIRFDFTPGAGLIAIQVHSTDPNRNGNYIRDITIVKEEDIEAFEAGAIFNPRWISKIKDTRSLRFMNWMRTNDSKISSWSQRPRTEDYTYTLRGAPLEVMVKLANEIGADPWFNMPHLADNTYMQSFAIYVRDNLDPKLKAHVEYSNEVWNFIFQQAQWANQQAVLRWGSNAHWMEFVGMKAAQMAQIWTSVYGPAAAQRLVRVIATHTGWRGLEDPLLNAPSWVSEAPTINQPPYKYFDAYGVTGYFGYELGEGTGSSNVLSWVANSLARAEAEATALGLTGTQRADYINAHRYDHANQLAYNNLSSGSARNLVTSTFPYHQSVANHHNLSMIMYEGGTHIVGIGSNVDNQTLTNFFVQFNYSPQMGQLYTYILNGWKDAGGTMFNVFVDVGFPSKWGSWGMLRHLNDTNPRYNAIKVFNESNPGWWETREEGTFD